VSLTTPAERRSSQSTPAASARQPSRLNATEVLAWSVWLGLAAGMLEAIDLAIEHVREHGERIAQSADPGGEIARREFAGVEMLVELLVGRREHHAVLADLELGCDLRRHLDGRYDAPTAGHTLFLSLRRFDVGLTGHGGDQSELRDMDRPMPRHDSLRERRRPGDAAAIHSVGVERREPHEHGERRADDPDRMLGMS